MDTASMYTGGESEQLLGTFMADRRNRVVLATKYTMSLDPNDPNAGGNNRKSLMRSVERSLRHLQTDYIDLLYLHVWDQTTPVEEVLRGLDDLVRVGKVLYVGVSDIPAWGVARMQTIVDLRGWAPLVALPDRVQPGAAHRGAGADPDGRRVRTIQQLEDNPPPDPALPPCVASAVADTAYVAGGALGVVLDESQQARLDEVSAVELGFPHDFMRMEMPRRAAIGDVTILPRH